MAPPASYTEASLAEYAHSCIRTLAETFTWSPEAGLYTEVVNETMLALGVSDLTSFSSPETIRGLRAVARRESWRAVLGALAARYDFNTDSQGFKRSQMYDMAKEQYSAAIADCAALNIDSPNRAALLQSVVYVHDPYMPLDQINPLVEYQRWP